MGREGKQKKIKWYLKHGAKIVKIAKNITKVKIQSRELVREQEN